MARAAFDFNDAAIALVADGAVVVQEAGYARATAGGLAFGAAARAEARLRPHETSNRHWRELSEAALPRPLGACRSPADIVHEHLAHLCRALPAGCEGVVAAVPSCWTPRQLGLLLGIARDVGLRIDGLVDSGVAACRRPYPGAELWNLELTLHDAGLTRVAQEGGATRAESQRLDWLSAETLERAAAQCIARAFLRTSRFDPFHDAASEQALYGRLGDWLAQLRARESQEFTLEYRGNEFAARVEAGDMRGAVGQALERLVQRLRTAVAAGREAVLQVPDRLADYPGALEALARLANWQVVILEPAAAAAGALRLRAGARGDAVDLATSLPWDREPAPARGAAAPGRAAGAVAAPTHVCFRGRVWRLGGAAFQVGTELAEGEFGLRLPATTQALSRRHCSIRVEDGRVLLHDHSRYGTRLNGHLVEGSAALTAGDVVEVGQPPVELLLVAEVRDDGAPA